MDLELRDNLTLAPFLVQHHWVVLFREDLKSLVIAYQMVFGPTLVVPIQLVERVDRDGHACRLLASFEALYRLLAHYRFY